MLRFIGPAVAVLIMVGCSAPAPSLKMFAPGATRIPPPATGSYSTQGSYYEGPNITAPPIGTGAQSGQPDRNRWQRANAPTPARLMADEVLPPSATTSRFKTTGFESSDSSSPTDGSTDTEAPIRIVEADARPSPASSDNQVGRGSDSTASVEPKPFRPSGRTIDISELPTPARSVTTDLKSRRVTSSATSQPSAAKSGALKVRQNSGWQAREPLNHSVRIAGR